MNFAWRIYRRLALAFPHEFQLVYGAEVMQMGEEMWEEIARRRGAAGLVRLLADIAVRVPIEYLSEMRRDMRYAGRALLRSPGFALVGIISMGLAIGLTTNVYSSKWEVLFHDLPVVTNPQELVMPQGSADGDPAPVSYYYVEQYGQQKSLFAGAAAFQTGIPFNVNFEEELSAKPERVFGQLVSPNYFSVLGVQAQRGRVLSSQLDKPGNTPVVVISDRFWRNRLNSSPDAVGQTLRLNGQAATIVGITPKNFNGALSFNPAELFVPTTVPATLAPELANDVLHQRHAREFLALLRLAPGVSVANAESGLGVITRHLDEQDASLLPRADQDQRVSLLSAGTMVPMPRKMKPMLMGFFIALMGLILMLACVNLANMLMARGAARRKELAIRLSVGASRFRLIRQMMSEGVLLSLLGGAAGLVLAYGLAVLNSRLTPPATVPIESNFSLDWRAGLFAFALAVLGGIGFSLAPALQATKTDVAPALKEGPMQLPAYRRFGLRNALMVSQVAASLMLLLITGFLALGISKADSIETKFDARTMYLLSLDPVRQGYTAAKAQALFEKLPEQLQATGSARSVALTAQPPFSLDDRDIQATAKDSRVQIPAVEEMVGANYFAALSEPLLAGREFESQDQRMEADGSHTLPVVLSESAKRRLFGQGNAIGRQLRDQRQTYEVVGVVRDLENGISGTQAILYVPLTRRDFARPPAGGITLMVRSSAGTDALAGIRQQIASLDPNLAIFNVRTLADQLELSRSAERFSVETYGGIGIFGLVLAAIGLAGVTAYAVAQRRKEIGIRTALGATKAQVVRLVLREGTALVCAGTVLGFLGAIALAKILSALWNMFVDALRFGSDDTRLLVGAPLLLAFIAILACYVPARAAAKIDPLRAIREE